ncbi:MAG: aminotransferase class V-fold PLP-dependent enzyme [Pyrinomonadaceae bacterium]
MNDAIRSLFPAASQYTYLNSAAVSPIPTTAIEAINWQLADVAANGSAHFNDWVDTKTRARDLVAEMLKVRSDQIAFLRNTSDGFSTIANGLAWKTGDNIVSFEREFPANFYPWRRIREQFGVELRLCPEREGRMDLDELISLIDSNTKIVAISAIQYASGYKADLTRIGRAARDADALFCVDIIQGFGATLFDLPGQFVDAACGASHKWLCAPEGCGILYLSDRARNRVKPTLVGWVSVETPWDFEDREQPFKSTALAWESGTGAASLFYGLEQSLKLLHETGVENIESHLSDLSGYLCDSLAGKDYDIVSSRAAGESSAILCIKHRGGLTSNQIAAQLEAEKIIISPRGDRIRIAPHFYNNIEDIDRLVKALP